MGWTVNTRGQSSQSESNFSVEQQSYSSIFAYTCSESLSLAAYAVSSTQDGRRHGYCHMSDLAA